MEDVGISAKGVDYVIDRLKTALSSEYFAYHMYRSAYFKLRDPRRSAVADELLEHSKEELEHADELEKRIQVLGGLTFNDPTEWDVWANYDIPSIMGSDFGDIVKVIASSEDDAVKMYTDMYNDLAEDPVTQDIILRILQKEQEHVYDVKYNIKGSM